MRRRQLKRLWARLKQLSTMQLTREELLMKLGAARRNGGMGRHCYRWKRTAALGPRAVFGIGYQASDFSPPPA